MALIARINAVCNLCAINRTLSVPNVYRFRADALHLFKRAEPPRQSQQRRSNSIFSLFRRPSIQKLKERDGIPDQYQLIYRNTMERYLLAGQVFTVVCASVLCVVLMTNNKWNSIDIELQWDTRPAATQNELYVFMAAFVVMCTLVQLLIVKMPLRIYQLPRQKHYVMILCRSLPFQTRRFTYELNQVVKSDPEGILPWKDCVYEIKDEQKVILLDHYFRTPADYNIMMGYQKSDEDDEA